MLWSSKPQASTTCIGNCCLSSKYQLGRFLSSCVLRWLQSYSSHRYQLVSQMSDQDYKRQGKAISSTWSGLYHSCGLRPHSPISKGVNPACEGLSPQEFLSTPHLSGNSDRLTELHHQYLNGGSAGAPELQHCMHGRGPWWDRQRCTIGSRRLHTWPTGGDVSTVVCVAVGCIVHRAQKQRPGLQGILGRAGPIAAPGIVRHPGTQRHRLSPASRCMSLCTRCVAS